MRAAIYASDLSYQMHVIRAAIKALEVPAGFDVIHAERSVTFQTNDQNLIIKMDAEKCIYVDRRTKGRFYKSKVLRCTGIDNAMLTLKSELVPPQ